jgi:hypothetical protein
MIAPGECTREPGAGGDEPGTGGDGPGWAATNPGPAATTPGQRRRTRGRPATNPRTVGDEPESGLAIRIATPYNDLV